MKRKSQAVFVSPEEWEPQKRLLQDINKGWATDFKLRKGRMPQYHITTFGCQMNEHDSEHLQGLLREAGFSASEQADAELLLFNTCCIREHAEARVFGNVGALQKRKEANPGLVIGVCGCMMQQPETAEALFKRYPFVDMVFGTHALTCFPEILHRTLEGERVIDVHDSDGRITEGLPTLRKQSASAFVTVMFGCNNYCTYCIVPYVRGRERSRRMEDILTDLRELVADGVREITLLGQNVNSYGLDLEGDVDFPALLRRANEVEGLERIRFMTSHPKDLSAGLIDAMADCDKVCNHIHLPVQSGSSTVLRAMNRCYSREEYLSLISRLRERVPEIDLTTDIIVGFPGETEEDFEQTLSLVESVGYASAFTFMYSPRRGTPAESMLDQVPQEVKKDRLQRLNDLQAEMTRRNNEKYIGRRVKVFVEGIDERTQSMAFGKTASFKMVYFPSEVDLTGQFIDVDVIEGRRASLVGKRIG